MRGFAEYDRYDALGLGELVRRREVSPADLLEEAIARAEAANPKLNAINARMYDLARADLEKPVSQGLFAGVPFLLKDLLHAYAGVPLTSGSAALRDYVPVRDSYSVERFRAAGLIPFGKTNVPEFGLLATTEPEEFGPTRNPWNLERSPGGSSGGSGAVVAAGIVPMASATDGGGSIRIPAAWCGLFGLKPSRGRTSAGPYYGDIWSGAVVDGVITRSVRDSAAALDVLGGAAPGDPYLMTRPERPFLDEVSTPPGKLRIAFHTDSPIGSEVDPGCREAVEEAIPLLEQLGHEIVEATPPIDGLAVARCYTALCAGHVAADLRLIARRFGPAVARQVEASTRITGIVGESTPAAAFALDRQRWNGFARNMARFHERFDLLLTPATGRRPAAIGAHRLSAVDRIGMRIANTLRAGRAVRLSGAFERLALEQMAYAPFTQLANFTGQPAMSVPLHWGEDGLPYGIHFTARLGEEATLLRLASQLEEARPWADRRPPAIDIR
jgi:amidase